MGFLATIFNPKIPKVAAQQPTVTGRDLVASTESDDPEAPVMGGQSSRKRKGIESLLVPTETIYKGGT